MLAHTCVADCPRPSYLLRSRFLLEFVDGSASMCCGAALVRLFDVLVVVPSIASVDHRP